MPARFAGRSVQSAHLVFENLEELGVWLGDAGHVDDAFVHSIDQGMVHAIGRDSVLAPRLLRRSHGRDHVTSKRARKVMVRRGDEGVGLLVADEIVKGHDPRAARRRRARVHRWLELCKRQCSLKGAANVARQ